MKRFYVEPMAGGQYVVRDRWAPRPNWIAFRYRSRDKADGVKVALNAAQARRDREAAA